jgi:arsenate reductase
MLEKPLVLFVCAHNAARSQMAEAIFRKYAGDRFRVASAGLTPTAVHPLTRQVLEEIGLETRDLRAKGTRDFLGRDAVGYAVFVCAGGEKECPRIFPFARESIYWSFDDPTQARAGGELQLATFRRVRGEIDTRIRGWLRELGVDVAEP